MLGSHVTKSARPFRRAITAALLLTASPAAFAAPKAPAPNTALVAALQAVSPDPLGGQLGLVAASARNLETRSERISRAEQTAMIEANRKAYAAWKNTRKS